MCILIRYARCEIDMAMIVAIDYSRVKLDLDVVECCDDMT